MSGYDSTMRLRLILMELALDRPPHWRDRSWWLVTGCGMLAPVLLWTVARVDSAGSVLRGPWAWLGIVGWQPLVEELLFRGLIQGQLLGSAWGHRTRGGLSLANLTTSLIFSGMHLLYHAPLWALAVLAPSLIFGWLREHHGSTWSAVVTHILYNLAFFLSAWWMAG